MGLSPFQLAGLALHLEVLVAFGAAEAESARVIADECYALGGVDWTGAEVAVFNPHLDGGALGAGNARAVSTAPVSE